MSKKNRSDICPDALALMRLIELQKRPMRLDAILRAARISRKTRKGIEQKLAELSDNGKLVRMPGGFWTIPATLKSVFGRFHAIPGRGGTVTPMPHEKYGAGEIFIQPGHTGGAWHNDLVQVLLSPGADGRQGKIVKILDRPQKEIVCRIVGRKGCFLFCEPLDRRLEARFRIGRDADPAVKLNHRQLVSIKPGKELSYGLWQAELVMAYASESGVAVQETIVKSSHDVPGQFPDLALEQALALPQAPCGADMAQREDWRHLPFVTIDGADARDFDDAIHVQANGAGWILRVAIADVSHYVREDARPGSLDNEALARANSWYFPQSVEPMLPGELSNGLCSLRPHEDRLALMAEIAFNEFGAPENARFAAVIMCSAGRLTYDEVWRFFSEKDGKLGESALADHDARIPPMLKQAFRLYKLLARQRRQRGALDFELPEPAYVFDNSGNLVSMRRAARNDAHRLIEEFMIAANEAVARHLASLSLPFLYRTHPQPDQIKLKSLFETMRRAYFGSLPADAMKKGAANPLAIREILAWAAGTSREYLVNRLCLRSMPQARYQPENTGHFGLASGAYCHFTSPIRRYADLLTHRALKYSLGIGEDRLPDIEKLWQISERLNRREREAIECEREMAKRLSCMFLKKHEGEILNGVISGVADFGVFVEFSELPGEGLIRIRDLGNEWFELDQPGQRLIGAHSGQVWSLGQSLETRVDSVDIDRLEIRLIPASRPGLRDFSEKKGKRALNSRSSGNNPRATKKLTWNNTGQGKTAVKRSRIKAENSRRVHRGGKRHSA